MNIIKYIYGKENNNWIVEGENDQFHFDKEIIEVNKKINDYKVFLKDKPARDSVLKSVEMLIKGVKNYFTNQDTEQLECVCDLNSLVFIERLYSYALRRTGRNTLLKQLEETKYLLYDVLFEEDKIIVKLYEDTSQLIFKKIHGHYKVTGANGLEAAVITGKVMDREYLSLLRVFKITTNKAEKEGLIK